MAAAALFLPPATKFGAAAIKDLKKKSGSSLMLAGRQSRKNRRNGYPVDFGFLRFLISPDFDLLCIQRFFLKDYRSRLSIERLPGGISNLRVIWLIFLGSIREIMDVAVIEYLGITNQRVLHISDGDCYLEITALDVISGFS